MHADARWCGHDSENPSRLKSRPIPDEVIAKLRVRA
jgi:hypothetical protein